MSTAGLNANRPLSPHLQIYRVTMTMAMSIIHRITGVGLYLGTVLLTPSGTDNRPIRTHDPFDIEHELSGA